MAFTANGDYKYVLANEPLVYASRGNSVNLQQLIYTLTELALVLSSLLKMCTAYFLLIHLFEKQVKWVTHYVCFFDDRFGISCLG